MFEGRVLVVEDELPIRKLISFNLQRSNFEVLETGEGIEGIELVKTHNPSLVILDLMLPDLDGFEICTRLRNTYPNLPIIILSAKGQDMDRIMGLEIGADDYIVKPFNPLELVARIRTILRRTSAESQIKITDKINIGPFILNLKVQRLFKDNKLIKLTTTEFHLMKLFFKNVNEPISRADLLDEVWGLNYFGDPKTVDVHIRRLREKIEEDPSKPKFLKTAWGFGYFLQDSEFYE